MERLGNFGLYMEWNKFEEKGYIYIYISIFSL